MENNQKKFTIDSGKGLDFNLIKEKVPNPDTPEKQSSFVYSRKKTRGLYTEILSLIPLWKGAVIIYGEDAGHLKPIDCTYSENNLREHFSKTYKKSSDGEMIDRFTWMEDLLVSGRFKKLKLFTTTSF